MPAGLDYLAMKLTWLCRGAEDLQDAMAVE